MSPAPMRSQYVAWQKTVFQIAKNLVRIVERETSGGLSRSRLPVGTCVVSPSRGPARQADLPEPRGQVRGSHFARLRRTFPGTEDFGHHYRVGISRLAASSPTGVPCTRLGAVGTRSTTAGRGTSAARWPGPPGIRSGDGRNRRRRPRRGPCPAPPIATAGRENRPGHSGWQAFSRPWAHRVKAMAARALCT